MIRLKGEEKLVLEKKQNKEKGSIRSERIREGINLIQTFTRW